MTAKKKEEIPAAAYNERDELCIIKGTELSFLPLLRKRRVDPPS